MFIFKFPLIHNVLYEEAIIIATVNNMIKCKLEI